MNTKKEIERHRLPCGAMTVAIDGVCRRRLRDHFDSLLDRLVQETHPEGVDEETLEVDEVELPKEGEAKETDDQMRDRLLREGKIKAEVKRELQKYEEPEETGEEEKQRLVEEGKMKLDVKKELSKYEEKIGLNKKESDDEKRQNMIKDGKLKAEVKQHLSRHQEDLDSDYAKPEEPEESDEDKKKRLVKEGKFKAEVRHEVKKHEDKLQGNSKMLQDRSGKIQKR